MWFRFSTNLDAARPDVNRLNTLLPGGSGFPCEGHGQPFPRKGDTITFPFQKNGKNFAFGLQVQSVHFNYFAGTIEVVLAIPEQPHQCFATWEAWFKSFRYGSEK